MARDFMDIAAEQGWTPESQVMVLLRYIGNQDSPEAFLDFLEMQVAGETGFDSKAEAGEACHNCGCSNWTTDPETQERHCRGCGQAQ